MKLHTFAICAYKESPFLRECIRSLLPQQETSDIILCTSTPNDYIKGLAEEFNLPLYCRDGKSDIQDDWNFACSMVKTQWVTVAHQDDYYFPDYSKNLTEKIREKPEAIFAFTDYRPMKNGKETVDINCIIKKMIRSPMKNPKKAASIKWKRRILSLGNSINCPSCAYNLALFKGNVFTSTLKFALDWDTFVKLAETDYPFIYISKVEVLYRIHSEATSKDYTESEKRRTDEYYMFRKFWPERFINLYFHLFKLSYRTYSYREDKFLEGNDEAPVQKGKREDEGQTENN